ncbi:hypothetical protein QUF75_05660 [Desulfococcaceae bacterium HSG7]|nr:hypothetical protein [Desulfococcaceae bacterium HSG7]
MPENTAWSAKIKHSGFLPPLNPPASGGAGCKKSLHLIFALLNFPSTDYSISPTDNAVTLIS